MPPKKGTKEIEPSDRATRSRNTDKPAPKYTYSSEDSFEENFSPNIDLASTGNLPRIPAHLLPPKERRCYSPTEFDSPTGTVDKTTTEPCFIPFSKIPTWQETMIQMKKGKVMQITSN